jgi:hypothetical protein
VEWSGVEDKRGRYLRGLLAGLVKEAEVVAGNGRGVT